MNKELTSNRQFLRETIELRKSIDEGFLSLGERLRKIRNEKLYEVDYETFEEFLSMLKISPGTASKLISIFEKYVMEYNIAYEKLSSVAWTSLYELLPLATSKTKALELVDGGGLMRREDIVEMVRDEKHGRDCKHKWIDVHFEQCSHCGTRRKVYNDKK